MRTLAIGDIHGCNTALVTLLKTVQPMVEDRIVFLGDYVDRGPASRQVIETLLDLKTSCSPLFLRGNHEVMILDSREDSLKDNLWQVTEVWTPCFPIMPIIVKTGLP
jgi:serine/threonine protein phosphatase 1